MLRQLLGEEDVIGPYVYENQGTQINAKANRHLLVELCISVGMLVANTFCAAPMQQKVSCYNIGYKPTDLISWASHSEIDFVLCSKDWHHSVREVSTNLLLPLSSHHFLLEVVLEVHVLKNSSKAPTHRKYDVSVLQNPDTACRFADVFNEHMTCSASSSVNTGPSNSVNLLYENMLEGFDYAAAQILPTQVLKPQKPWISAGTIQLLERRKTARLARDYDEEQVLARLVKVSVKQDRTNWLETLTATGDWNEIRKLRKGFVPKQGRLKTIAGDLVASDLRADT